MAKRALSILRSIVTVIGGYLVVAGGTIVIARRLHGGVPVRAVT